MSNEANKKISKTPEYSIWKSAKNRCLNKSNHAYPSYGGRGISISEEWMSFENFIKDMGLRPSPLHSLERKNNDQGYNKDNCKWALPIEQSQNKRSTIRYNGQCLSDYCSSNALNYKAILQRIENGWSIEEAIETPIQTKSMTNENTPILPIPFSKKAKRNMLRLQGEHQIKHGKKISLKNLAGKILETASI